MHSTIPSHHPKYRTKLCRNFASGGCPFGQKCSFLHPAPRIIPSSASLAQHLFNRNALFLPQLLALSNRQATQKQMLRRSQGPALVDEDPSPSTSLLLSKSDCTSPDRVRHSRQPSKRKKYPCRHFIRTGGWCPAAGQCKFHHDVAALTFAGVQKADRAPPFVTDAHREGGRTISGGGLMGIQSSTPPIVSQAHSEPRYAEAELVPPCSFTRYPSVTDSVLNDRSDQPMHWPNYTWQPYQPYYVAVPATVAMPIPPTAGPSSIAQPGVYPQLPAETMPPRETQINLMWGSYEVNGTTYFPTSVPSAPAPPPPTYSMPVHPVAYNHAMAPTYPYYAPPAQPAGYYDIPNQTTDVGPPTSFDPFASDWIMPSELPVIPRLEDCQMSPIQQDALALPFSSPSAPGGDQGLTTTSDEPTVTQEHEFPYRPPKGQWVGHARRISVNIKKRARVNSG